MINRSKVGVRGLLVLFFSFNLGWGQSTLSAGGIAIVAFAFDNPDELSFIALEDIASSTVIYFTDNGWKADNSWRANEGTHTWTADASYAAGDIINFELSGPALSSSGDQIIAYQGSSGDPTFLFAINSEGSGWQSDATNANTSAIPQGLTNGTNAIAFSETDNGYYSGTIGATAATMLSNVCNTDNWTTSNSRLDPGDYDPLPIRFSVSISGNSGFRLMGSPVAGTVYDDILGDLWIQGMTNGDVTNGTANVWTFDVSGQSWSALSNLNTASQTAGEGFLVYVFADTDFDGDDDLPVTLSVSGTVNSSSATVPSSGSIADGEYALAGNPYAQTIDWDDVTKTNMSSTVYVYDDAKSGGAGWIDWNGSAGDLSNGLIAPYQGFIIKGSGGSGTITIETADQASSSGTFYKTAQTYSATFTVTSETSSQNFYFSFNQDGNVGMDSHDAHKLMPLDITPRLVGMTFADGNSLGTNNLPLNLTGNTEIDVDVMSLDVTDGVFETAGEDVTLSWDLSAAPAGLSFMLTNTQTQETADLNLTDAYTFTTQEKGSVVSDGSGVSSYPLVGTPLLKLTISALSQNVDENPMPSAFALHPAYPNPFNPSTTITFDVPDYIAQPTLLQIYDISGSLVQTLVNGVVDPGTHSVSWGPKNLSSGIYIVELRAGDNTFNHKISYVK